MVSRSQLTAGSAADARHRPGAACFAAGPDPHCRADRRRCRGRPRGPGHVEHEKKTFFSSLQNSRSGAVSQGRAQHAAPAVEAQRRAFTDGAAEATRA